MGRSWLGIDNVTILYGLSFIWSFGVLELGWEAPYYRIKVLISNTESSINITLYRVLAHIKHQDSLLHYALSTDIGGKPTGHELLHVLASVNLKIPLEGIRTLVMGNK
nr:hypothetical protein Itr_chr14CG13140 [Ipomoea trifida]